MEPDELATNPVAEATIDAPVAEVADEALEPVSDEVVQPDDDSEEIEHEGQKYRLPKALKPLMMFQADYTRKTQEVAEQRKALDTERTAFGEQAKAQQEHIRDLARLYGMDEQLERYAKADWDRFYDQDPVGAGKAQGQWKALEHARNQLAGQLGQKEQERLSRAQQETAKRMEEAHAQIRKDIPDWSPDLASKLREFAVSKGGMKPEEIAGISDPRHVKLLHLAYVGAQAVEKQRAAAAKPPTPEAKPVPVVAARAAPLPRGLDDRLSTEEWMKRRNAQVSERRR